MTDRPDLFRRLREALADCYPQVGLAKLFAHDAGLNLAAIDFSGPAIVYWQDILREAERKGQVEALLDLAIKAAPARADLVTLREECRQWQNVNPKESASAELSLDRAEAILREGARSDVLPGWKDFGRISRHRGALRDRLTPHELSFALRGSLQHGVDEPFWARANAANPDAVAEILAPIVEDHGHRPLLRAGWALEQLTAELRSLAADKLKQHSIYYEIIRQVIQAALEQRTVRFWQEILSQDYEYCTYARKVLREILESGG